MSIVVQQQSQLKHIPSEKNIIHWVKTTLGKTRLEEITIRIVNKKESAFLNETYRHKTGPTNVLSFVYEEKPVLGDIVLCAPLIPDEATWKHLVVHGTLHLMGYDHIDDKEADIMESRETKILRKLRGK